MAGLPADVDALLRRPSAASTHQEKLSVYFYMPNFCALFAYWFGYPTPLHKPHRGKQEP